MDRLPIFNPDGYRTPEVGRWTREKYRRVSMYQQIFAEAMKSPENWWRGKRAYVDLFAGPGRVQIRRSRVVHRGTPLLAMMTEPSFDRYVFCDLNSDNIDDLEKRARKLADEKQISQKAVRFINGDVNDSTTVERILSNVPEEYLTLCFVDPYNCELRFDSISKIGEERRVDFLILLALGMDANLNWSLYLKPDHTRLENFLGNPKWRQRWKEERERVCKEVTRRPHPVTFLASEYSRSMEEIGYCKTGLDDMYLVRSSDRNLPLYYLAIFSRAELAYDLWQQVLTYSKEQIDMGI